MLKYNPTPGIFIGLGANLNNPQQQLKRALAMIADDPNIHIEARSHFYESLPMGPQDQPNYTNAVIKVATNYSPHQLLQALQQFESLAGRVRDRERWGPRVLDLDILLFGDLRIDDDVLTVPHNGMAQREFVLVPLFEIQPDIIMPDNQPLAQWVAQCDLNQLKRIAGSAQSDVD